MDNNTEIHQSQYEGSEHQKWKLIPTDDGNHFVIQCKHSKKVLAVSDRTGKVIQYTLRNGNNQRWILSEVSIG